MADKRIYPCPMCEAQNQLFDERLYDICRNCGWEDDSYQYRNHDKTGANGLTWNQAKELLRQGGKIYPDFPKIVPPEELPAKNDVIKINA